MKLAIALALLGALGAAAILLGLPDVAATTPHWVPTRWLLETTMERSVARRARGVAVLEGLDAPARIRAGARAYDGMCVGCHAAPGVEPGVVARGLLPEPPELAVVAEEWSAAELFWITKHGIRMTGMPAFGPTHSDAELWEVVAFLRVLPALTPEAYRALLGPAADGGHDGHGHEHSHGEE